MECGVKERVFLRVLVVDAYDFCCCSIELQESHGMHPREERENGGKSENRKIRWITYLTLPHTPASMEIPIGKSLVPR